MTNSWLQVTLRGLWAPRRHSSSSSYENTWHTLQSRSVDRCCLASITSLASNSSMHTQRQTTITSSTCFTDSSTWPSPPQRQSPLVCVLPSSTCSHVTFTAMKTVQRSKASTSNKTTQTWNTTATSENCIHFVQWVCVTARQQATISNAALDNKTYQSSQWSYNVLLQLTSANCLQQTTKLIYWGLDLLQDGLTSKKLQNWPVWG